jgi:hypothetical protein
MTYRALDGEQEQTIALEGRSIPIGFNSLKSDDAASNNYDNYEKIKEFYENRL